MAKTLREISRVIRSKNAGPFELTLDIIFQDRETYEAVRALKTLSPKAIAGLYGIGADKVREFVWFAPANSLKITLARPIDSGSIGERDTYGAQQHAPLLLLTFDL